MFKKRTPCPEQRRAFGKLIRDARNRHGFTQEQLAEYLNCSVRWIIQIEEGSSCPNNMDTVLLMLALELTAGNIAEEVGWSVCLPANRK